jgi:hypothetical protein
MHLFYRCHKIKHVLDELKHIFNINFEKNIVLVEENLIIGVYEGAVNNLPLGSRKPQRFTNIYNIAVIS